MMGFAGKWIMAAGIFVAAAVTMAASDTNVESTRPVESSDGLKTAVVDRFISVVDGEAERFSGRMLLRVQSKDGTAARQRYIEASQVRVIQPPVWLDGSRLCAFVYNVAKNSNGIVYFEPETNRALQVEFVMPARQMAASGNIEQELTSLEITEFAGQETLKVRNVPWQGGSAFPLVLKPLPEFWGQPYDVGFYKQVNAAIAAYKQFLKKHDMQHLEPEQASESFSADGKWLGLLACEAERSWLLGIPLESAEPAVQLERVRATPVQNVSLSCAQHLAGEVDTSLTDSRYLTGWKSDTVLQVLQETYGAESEEPVVTPIAHLDMISGSMTGQGTTATKSAATTGKSATVPEVPLVLAPSAMPQ